MTLSSTMQRYFAELLYGLHSRKSNLDQSFSPTNYTTDTMMVWKWSALYISMRYLRLAWVIPRVKTKLFSRICVSILLLIRWFSWPLSGIKLKHSRAQIANWNYETCSGRIWSAKVQLCFDLQVRQQATFSFTWHYWRCQRTGQGRGGPRGASQTICWRDQSSWE